MQNAVIIMAAVSELPALLKREDLAHRWQKHIASIDRMISSGAIRAVKVGAAVRIPRSEVARIEAA